MNQRYHYLGDRQTRSDLKGCFCTWVKDARDKCVRGRNGNALVMFEHSGEKCIVLARRLRKVL